MPWPRQSLRTTTSPSPYRRRLGSLSMANTDCCPIASPRRGPVCGMRDAAGASHAPRTRPRAWECGPPAAREPCAGQALRDRPRPLSPPSTRALDREGGPRARASPPGLPSAGALPGCDLPPAGRSSTRTPARPTQRRRLAAKRPYQSRQRLQQTDRVLAFRAERPRPHAVVHEHHREPASSSAAIQASMWATGSPRRVHRGLRTSRRAPGRGPKRCRGSRA